MGTLDTVTVTFVLYIFTIVKSLHGNNEYCLSDTFKAKCSVDEVIVISSASYGFMGIGRCVTVDLGVNCSVDVKHYLDATCSWKNECEYDIASLDQAAPCLAHIRPYLKADYMCMAVETSHTCIQGKPVYPSGMTGSLSSYMARQSGCGSLMTPWRITIEAGQSLEIYFVNYMQQDHPHLGQEDNCRELGFITNHATQKNISVCASNEVKKLLYKTEKGTTDIQIVKNKLQDDIISDEFVLEYKVFGCTDLLTPDHAWYQRSGQDAVIGCKHRNMTWHLHCEGNRWNGVMGKCHDEVVKMTTEVVQHSTTTSHQFLILVGVIAAIFITLLVCITVAIFKLIDRRNAKQLAKQQILLDTSTSHRYSGGPQRHDPLMYHERIEMVPDILENSLRRTYAPGKADSESSSQTNYPGTLYFMGTLGHNVQSPVVEAIPLPRKPASVSDSESEHLYDSIPADCT